MIDYPELVQKVVNLVGGRGLLGKLLKKAARTVGNWISGTNQPCEMTPVKMLILLIDSENKEDRAYAVNTWHKLLNTDFRPIK